jgi:hypothetical protein
MLESNHEEAVQRGQSGNRVVQDSDLKLVRSIALPALNAYATSQDSLPNLMKKFTLSKIFTNDFQDRDNFRDPKMMHFIAEHVHPSLEVRSPTLVRSLTTLSPYGRWGFRSRHVTWSIRCRV